MSNPAIIISDLHLNMGGPTDDFHQDELLAERLYDWKDEGMTIIGNGDLADITQAHSPGESVLETFTRIVEAHPTVSDALRHCLEYWVLGNHEMELSYGFGCTLVKSLEIGRTHIEHGQEFDWFNGGPFGWVGDAATRIAGLLEHLHSDADRWASRAVYAVLRQGRHGRKEAYARCAQRLLRERGEIEQIVLGHTHRKDKQLWMEGSYFNSGTWTGEKADFIHLDLGD